MRGSNSVRLTRSLLLCLLALGVVGVPQVGAALGHAHVHRSSSMVATAGVPAPHDLGPVEGCCAGEFIAGCDCGPLHGEHGFVHLCLAVLAGTVLVELILLRGGVARKLLRAAAGSGARLGPPPRRAAVLLASLGTFRL